MAGYAQLTLDGEPNPTSGKRQSPKLKQPLKWHGGKHYQAEWIVSMMPPHLHFCEPFFGGGSVLLARDPHRNWLEGHPSWKNKAHLNGSSEVINDLNGDLINFWRVLQDRELFDEFHRILSVTPFSKPRWQSASQSKQVDPIPRAVDFFVTVRQSMSGRQTEFSPLQRSRTRGKRNGDANAWLNCIDRLPEIHERLIGVVIYSEKAIDVIQREDTELTLFYLDPPYLHNTRITTAEYGAHEMSEDEHRELLEALATLKGKFILSGYPSELYDGWAKEHGFRCVTREIDNKASAKKTKEMKTECLWMN